MNKKGMTLGVEILIIVFFTFAAFLSVYILVKSFTGKYEVSEEKISYYHNIEKELVNASKKYMEDKNLTEKIIVTADTLKKKGLFDSECNGYVVIDKNFYTPYIRCREYETNGYLSSLAN